MKSLFIAVLFSISISTASANEITVTRAAQQSFQKAFSQAQNVSWSKVDEMYKVSFTLDNHPVFAFFSADGVLSAATRYVTQAQLSLGLQGDLKNYLGTYVLHEIFEVNNENGTTYYATLRSPSKMLVLQSSMSKWSVFKKSKN